VNFNARKLQNACGSLPWEPPTCSWPQHLSSKPLNVFPQVTGILKETASTVTKFLILWSIYDF
jgi:hypothetical protein